jgi:hypothetical protein
MPAHGCAQAVVPFPPDQLLTDAHRRSAQGCEATACPDVIWWRRASTCQHIDAVEGTGPRGLGQTLVVRALSLPSPPGRRFAQRVRHALSLQPERSARSAVDGGSPTPPLTGGSSAKLRGRVAALLIRTWRSPTPALAVARATRAMGGDWRSGRGNAVSHKPPDARIRSVRAVGL